MKAVIFTSPHIADEVIIINGFLRGEERDKEVKKLKWILFNSISVATLEKLIDELNICKEENKSG
ncbi:MAG: hypothetical protein DRM99_00900 [Thermoplasmata archaeon]|nr:MAG: hypothetical protein DRM99_00900 [Thermoplasmata archaeon]